MRASRQAASLLVVVAAVLGGPPAGAQRPIPAPAAAAKIRALLQEKAARTPIQRKISSRLLQAERMHRGRDVAPGVRSLRTGVAVDAAGTVLVDVRARPIGITRARIEALGGQVLAEHRRSGLLRARLPLLALEALAAEPAVRRIRPAERYMLNKLDTTEGDVAHKADQARAAFLVDGTGITVGVLSDGVDTLAARQASGDLPPGVTVLPGLAGSGDEGTAMLEIVHDLAPGANLLFATALFTQAAFADNIRALRDAGADVIVDDVFYFAEAAFQDDDVAAAVDEVAADGVLYFSSAGNSGNLNDGTSGVWEGDWAFSGTTLNGQDTHDFGGGDFTNEVVDDSPSLFTLKWADAQGASGNDYDLFLLNDALTVIIASSTDTQDGDDDPYEDIDSTGFDDTGTQLIVVQSAGAGRFLQLNTHRGRLEIGTDGQTSGHAAAAGAIAVAAVGEQFAGPGGIFDGTEPVETYSSDGPRRVFHAADGTPFTPGNFSSTGGVLRQKPDLSGADCVATSTPGFGNFCGTSAAAPHAAAIAALLLQIEAAVGVSPGEIEAALAATALDIEAPGVDRDSGAGIVDALAAATTTATFDCSDGLDNDGDGFTDFPADPGCQYPTSLWEDPQCQDGISNDADGLVDFDGGASILGAPATAPDPQCQQAFQSESKSCGLGFEVALLLLPLALLRRRVRDVFATRAHPH